MWVGYAADEETPEMIMKKFEALERLKANIAVQQQKSQLQIKASEPEASIPADSSAATESPWTVPNIEEPPVPPIETSEVQLTEQQLEKVFKITSMFVVPTGSREVVYDVGEGFQDQDLLNQLAVDDDSSGFAPFLRHLCLLVLRFPLSRQISDEEAFFTLGGDGPKKPKAKRERTKKRDRSTSESARDKSRMKLVSMEVVGMDGYTYTVKKKVKYALTWRTPCSFLTHFLLSLQSQGPLGA